jgi:hypothetical protein
MIGDYIDRQEKWAKWERWVRWMKWTARGLALTGVLLIFFGAMAVVNSGLRGINCPGGHNAFGSAFDVFCKPKSNS